MKRQSQIFFRPGFLGSTTLSLSSEEKQHLKSLRLEREKFLLEIRDGNGLAYLYEYIPQQTNFSLIEKIELPSEPKAIRVALAYPRSGKMEFFLEKGTELGVTEIFFVLWERSIRKEINLERVVRICSGAAAQSFRNRLPQIFEVEAKHWIPQNAEGLLLLDPEAQKPYHPSEFPERIPMVGPEGGFTEKEKVYLESVLPRRRLTPTVLRTETAALAAVALQATIA